MLSALLPGVREFRTPLMTGLLWAGCVWLVLGDQIATSGATERFITQTHLAALPGTALTAGAVTLAYLVGSLLIVRTTPFGRYGDRFRMWLRWKVERLDKDQLPYRRRYRGIWRLWHKYQYRAPATTVRGFATADLVDDIDGWLHNEFEKSVADGRVPLMRSFGGGCMAPSGFDGYYDPASIDNSGFFHEDTEWRSHLAESFVAEVKREQPAVEVRLQMRFPEVYAEIDRLRMESQLRLSIFWPLTVLALLLAWAWSPFLLAALIFPPALLRDGLQRGQEARRKTWGALVSGEVSSPIMDAMTSARTDACRDFGQRFRNPEMESVA